MDFDEEITKDDFAMKKALKEGNAKDYYTLCNKLGMPMEAVNPHLYSEGEIIEVDRRQSPYLPNSESIHEFHLGEWTVDLAFRYLLDGPNVSSRMARERLSKFKDSNYPVPNLSRGDNIVDIYNNSVKDIVIRARFLGIRPN